VYTETVIHSAAPAFTAEVPFQTAIVDLEGGGRITGRILGDRVVIGDHVAEIEVRNGVPFFQKA